MSELETRIISIRFRIKWKNRCPSTDRDAYMEVFDYLIAENLIQDVWEAIPYSKVPTSFFENIEEVVNVTFHATCNG